MAGSQKLDQNTKRDRCGKLWEEDFRPMAALENTVASA